MPLLTILRSSPDAIVSMNLQQIVSAAGDGDLKDQSVCSAEFREFLREASVDKLARYIDECLAQPLPKGGYILQDLVNELGRRLDYDVENGRYAGVVGQIGFDGLWLPKSDPALIVEVKTTDTYRISLDTLAAYRSKLIDAGKCDRRSSLLIVVGRQDTGELEAQIRGSRHAWDVRLISAEALLRLVEIKENAEQGVTADKIRGLLRPTEYTRLDALVDVVFSASRETENLETIAEPAVSANGAELVAAGGNNYVFTAPADLAAKRNSIVDGWSQRVGRTLIAKSKALFWSSDRTERIVCTISKRYDAIPGRPYWYAYHPAWRDFLLEGGNGHLILGMMDLNLGFALPAERLESCLQNLNTTFKPDGKTYWHLHVRQESNGTLALYIPGQASMALDEFSFPLG